MSRESELYKDKIEVSLDGRQIFYLFFGGAVIVGLVFVLGVMVGRRVEARGHADRAHVEATVDPLAALDRLESGNGLSFQGSLRGADAPVSDVEKKIEEKKAQPAAAVKKVEEKKVEEKKVEEKKVEEKKAEEKKAEEKKVEPKKDDKASEKTAEKTEKTEKTAEKTEKKQKFTLQLSSFKDKAEAEAFLESVKSAGYQAYVTEGDVDGKQFYRVRMGTYRTVDAANDAKADFEKSLKKSALVTKL